MLIGPDRRIFVGRRAAMAPGTGWQMPQGGIDADESPVEAAFRELGEEAGTAKALLLRESRDWIRYDVPPDAQPRHWKGRWHGQAQKWFALAFTGKESDIDLSSHGDPHGPEFDAWKWATAAEVLSLVVPFKRVVYQAVLMEFADLVS